MATRTEGLQCDPHERRSLSGGQQGKTRPLGRPPRDRKTIEVGLVKAKMARFTMALSLLATIALTLGAGVKWN